MKIAFFLALLCSSATAIFGAVENSPGVERRDIHLHNEIGEWTRILNGAPPFRIVYERLISKGYSDNEICDELIARIEQPEVPVGRKEGYVSANASLSALDLFRGNVHVERAVLAACDVSRYKGPLLNPKGFLRQAIAHFGSDELIVEYRALMMKQYGSGNVDLGDFDEIIAARPRHKRGDPSRDTSSSLNESGDALGYLPPPDASRREFPRHPNSSNFRASQNPITEVFKTRAAWWLLALAMAGLLAVCWWCFRTQRIWPIAGIVLIASGGGLYFLLPNADTMPSPPEGPPMISPGSKAGPQETTPARFKPEAWRPQPPSLPVPSPRERTPDDILSDEVRQLMAPFHAADPLDREGNQKAKEEAAMKLLAIIEKGMPQGSREDNWPGVVGQIIGCQACSPACMDRAMEMIGKWIGDPQRTEQETMTALGQMARWLQMDAVNPGSPELKRFERIAAMQEEMFHKISPATQGMLLIQMEGFAKLVNRTKSQMPEKIVDDKRLLGLMETMRKGAADDPNANSRIMMAMRNRVVSAPESLATFDAMAKEILTGGKTDAMGTMQGLEMIAKASRSGTPLPSWMDDAGIVRKIAALHQEASKAGKNSLAVQRTGFVSSMAMAVIRERMMADPASVAKHYNEVLMAVAKDADAGRDFQLEAVRTAVKAGVMGADDARIKFGSDPAIGEDVKKEFPEK